MQPSSGRCQSLVAGQYGRIVSHADAAGECCSAGSAKSRVPHGGTWMTCSPLHPPVRTAARSRAPGSATLSNAPADVARRMTTGSDVGQSTAVLRRDRTAELCTPLAWFRTECTSSSTGTCVPCRSYCCSWVRLRHWVGARMLFGATDLVAGHRGIGHGAHRTAGLRPHHATTAGCRTITDQAGS